MTQPIFNEKPENTPLALHLAAQSQIYMHFSNLNTIISTFKHILFYGREKQKTAPIYARYFTGPYFSEKNPKEPPICNIRKKNPKEPPICNIRKKNPKTPL